MYTATDIARIIQADLRQLNTATQGIQYLSMDSRRLENPASTLFFALRGSLHDGHQFLADAIKRGVRHCVAEYIPAGLDDACTWFIVPDCLVALQQLAAHHRASFPDLPVLAITGSNGKTTIKEWLDQLISDRRVVRSPKSYNSQTGVAFSLWQIAQDDEFGIFEAGISLPGEMERLERMISPGIGLFTMLGDAHAEGFQTPFHKLEEKLTLFRRCHTILFEEDQQEVALAIRQRYTGKNHLSWGESPDATLFRIISRTRQGQDTYVTLSVSGTPQVTLTLPFTDRASVQNCLHCVAVLLYLKMPLDYIRERVMSLQNLPMRLEMKYGLRDCILINDTYNADLQSCRIALDFLQQQAGDREKLFIVSEFLQTGLTARAFCEALGRLTSQYSITEVIAVGSQVQNLRDAVDGGVHIHFFPTTEALLEQLPHMELFRKAILVKGARAFQLEKVIAALSEKAHTAVLETDLQAVEHNLRVFTGFLVPAVQTIAVIKASAYGSGSEQLARFLEYRKVSYLAVAFIDEGIQLRKAGIRLPVMVLNPDRNGMADMVRWQLEPEVYSREQLQEIIMHITTHHVSSFRIHLKLDTGMHRLGFMEYDLPEAADMLAAHPAITVVSVFSHLTSSEDAADDAFTHRQARAFEKGWQLVCQRLGYAPKRHLLNSAGIARFPEYQYDMVRLGLGLYGLDTSAVLADKLERAHSLKATVIQVKEVGPGARVGYNRKGIVSGGGRIAVVNMGYADGLMRMAGNGCYSLRIRHRDFPIVGNICMDLTMVDLGDCEDVSVGDDVIVFGKNKPVEELAAVCQTIPYEILSRISARVRRLYTQG